ncbi:hypothetical protein ACFQXA_12070 [Nocardiopsis composta]
MTPVESVPSIAHLVADAELAEVEACLGGVDFTRVVPAYRSATRERPLEAVGFRTALEAFDHLRELAAGPDGLPPEVVFTEEVAKLRPVSRGRCAATPTRAARTRSPGRRCGGCAPAPRPGRRPPPGWRSSPSRCPVAASPATRCAPGSGRAAPPPRRGPRASARRGCPVRRWKSSARPNCFSAGAPIRRPSR